MSSANQDQVVQALAALHGCAPAAAEQKTLKLSGRMICIPINQPEDAEESNAPRGLLAQSFEGSRAAQGARARGYR